MGGSNWGNLTECSQGLPCKGQASIQELRGATFSSENKTIPYVIIFFILINPLFDNVLLDTVRRISCPSGLESKG